MRIKRIAACVLILYAAIFVALAFHNHFTEPARKHCNACQIMHAPGFTPAVTTYTPLLIVQGTLSFDVDTALGTLLVLSSTERAPPTV